MEIDIKESLKIAKHFKEKKERGETLKKGEEIILNLGTEYAKLIKQEHEISNELCVDIIKVHKKRIDDTNEDSIPVDKIEMNMLLDGLFERLNLIR